MFRPSRNRHPIPSFSTKGVCGNVPLGTCPMTPHDKNEEQDLAHHWDPLDPEVKKQFAISVFLRKRHKLFSCPSFLISTKRSPGDASLGPISRGFKVRAWRTFSPRGALQIRSKMSCRKFVPLRRSAGSGMKSRPPSAWMRRRSRKPRARAGPGCRRCGPLAFHVVADVTTAISRYTRLSAPSYVGRVLGLAAVVVKHMDRLT